MPRAGLDRAAVVAAGAAIADEVGFANLSMGLVAERLGVRTPSLYKHVESQADLSRGIALLAATEASDAIRDAIQGLAGAGALAALARALRAYVLQHPGRYAATTGAMAGGPDDPLVAAGDRLLDSMRAVLRCYQVPAAEMDHALRTLRSLFHGFATLQAENGFQRSADTDESYDWLIAFADTALRHTAAGRPAAARPAAV
ncbi:TetR/AcrR family transcriptional regulator [Micromonosporaceae bacterium Da 78-11]